MHNAETLGYAAFFPWIEMQVALEDANGWAHVDKARARIGFLFAV
jgi:hypothetical protein